MRALRLLDKNLWLIGPVVALAILLALFTVVPPANGWGGPPTDVVTHIRNQSGDLPCFNPSNSGPTCAGQVTVAGDVVWDVAKVFSNLGLPTGTVEFRFYVGTAHCDLAQHTTQEFVTAVGPIAFNTTGASSSSFGYIPAGSYSYRAIYHPDAAAQALGIGRTPGECEQLLVK